MNSIIRWNPFREMATMQTAMDRLFEDFWRGNWPNIPEFGRWETPALDIHESDTAYIVNVPLPGIQADQIEVKMQNGMLTISGELPEPTVEPNTKVVVQERYYGKFSRSVTLPQSVDVDKVEARYENGVLTLTLPKLPDAQPKVIPIKTPELLRSKN